MTTIATDGKSMGSDGRSTSGDTILESDRVKVFRLNNGALIGFAGSCYNFDSIVNYYNSKKRKKQWPNLRGNISILLLETNGNIYTIDCDGRALKRDAPVALGSGWEFATVAMKCGKSVEDAIKVACEHDVYSGGKITVLSL